MNNTCQNNFCIYIMLGFCPFLKVKLFFFLIFEFYFAILRNLAHSVARALQLLTFSEFLCLNIQNGTDGNHDSGQEDQGTPKEKQREAWRKKITRNRGSTVLSGGNSHIIAAYNINSKIKITRYIIKKQKLIKTRIKKQTKTKPIID